MKEAETISEALVFVKTVPKYSVQNISTINVAIYSVVHYIPAGYINIIIIIIIIIIITTRDIEPHDFHKPPSTSKVVRSRRLGACTFSPKCM
jgi:hypothetical protein